MQMGYRSNKSIDPRSAGGKWILLIFLAAGLILLAIAGFLALRHARKLESYARTTAVIVGFDEQRDGDETTHRTIVEYLVEGSPRQATVGVYSSSFFVGDELSAAYDPKNPGDLILTGVWGWLGSAICAISRQSEWLRSKSLQIINAGEGVEKREPSYTGGGNAN